MVYGTYNELVTGANLNQLTSLGGLTLYGFLTMVKYRPISPPSTLEFSSGGCRFHDDDLWLGPEDITTGTWLVNLWNFGIYGIEAMDSWPVFVVRSKCYCAGLSRQLE